LGQHIVVNERGQNAGVN